ncbi:MAG: hypothetical protein J3Q66DRAFT_351076 [Benniella sp.]|nr:MAG: hypothetical protein J3Q66DRAFT_351076 [Benniella sp.]
MTNVLEVDDLIFKHLCEHDLSQCARVNKTWYTITIPYLWGDLSDMSETMGSLFGNPQARDGFGKMVLEDYLHEQKYGKAGHSQLATMSTLAKYGRWIRLLPDPDDFLELFDKTLESHKGLVGRGEKPTAYELLFHLFQHCPTAQIQYLSLEYERLGSDNLWRTTVEYVLPRTCFLYVDAQYHGPHPKFRELTNLLSRCSSALTRLELTVKISYTDEEMKDPKEAQEETESKETESEEWTSLKYLNLFRCNDNSGSKAFWSWLWKRCGHVEELNGIEIDGFAQSLAEGMVHMPKVEKLQLGSVGLCAPTLTDDDFAAILSGSSKGLKVVKARRSIKFGARTVEALAKHFSTIEELDLELGEDHCVSHGPLRVLSSGCNLRTLTTLEGSCFIETYPRMDATVFIDQDPTTGVLRPWPCEASLKVLSAKITGIPRPDLPGHETVKETYPGQGREIQSKVYDRLARLTHLEILCLGRQPFSRFDSIYEDEDNFACLELSLESGLGKLEGLKMLKELDVSRLMTKIGRIEVQWMIEHWPRLHTIHGLERASKDAIAWLREHRPHVQW